VIEKLSEKPFYRVLHAVEDYRKIGGKMFPDKDIHDNQLLPMAIQPLTPEELSWERYDFDKLYKVTGYRKLLKKLAVFIAQVDAVFKTDFLNELKKLAEAEQIEWDAKSLEEAPKQEEKKAETVVEIVKEEAPVVRETRTETVAVAKSKSGITKDELLKAGYKVENYSDSELALVEGIDGDGEIMWKEGYTLLDCNNEDCGYPAPQEVSSCIKCGKQF